MQARADYCACGAWVGTEKRCDRCTVRFYYWLFNLTDLLLNEDDMDAVTAVLDDKPRVLPPEGQHQFVCVDGIDLGLQENKAFGKTQPQYAIVFQLEATNPENNNKRFELSQRFTVSMFEKANLRKFLGQWRGKSYTDEESEKGAPLASLAGANGLMQIEHKTSKTNGKTYANILSVGPLPRGVKKLVAERYERAAFWEEVKARAIKPKEPEDPNNFPAALVDEDDDLRF